MRTCVRRAAWLYGCVCVLLWVRGCVRAYACACVCACVCTGICKPLCMCLCTCLCWCFAAWSAHTSLCSGTGFSGRLFIPVDLLTASLPWPEPPQRKIYTIDQCVLGFLCRAVGSTACTFGARDSARVCTFVCACVRVFLHLRTLPQRWPGSATSRHIRTPTPRPCMGSGRGMRNGTKAPRAPAKSTETSSRSERLRSTAK